MSRLTRLLINNQPGFLPELSSSQAVHLPLVQQAEVPHHWKIAMIVMALKMSKVTFPVRDASVQKEYLHR